MRSGNRNAILSGMVVVTLLATISIAGNVTLPYAFTAGTAAKASEVNGNFAARLDLSQVKPGEYAIYVAGGVVDGMDALGKVNPGYNPTGYKIQVK